MTSTGIDLVAHPLVATESATRTALSISHAARVGADLLDRADAAGLPTNLSITARIDYELDLGKHEAVRFLLYGDDFSDLHAWAAWLGVEAVEYVGGSEADPVTFCDAVATVDGVRIQLAANRRDR